MASKDDQILALLVEIRSQISSVDARLRRVEEELQGTHRDVVTAGQWTKEIHGRR